MAKELFNIIDADYKQVRLESAEGRFQALKHWRDYFSPTSTNDQRSCFYDALEKLHYSGKEFRE